MKEINEALKTIETGKAAGCFEIKADMFKVLEQEGTDILYEVQGAEWAEELIPEDWSISKIIPFYRQNGALLTE